MLELRIDQTSYSVAGSVVLCYYLRASCVAWWLLMHEQPTRTKRRPRPSNTPKIVYPQTLSLLPTRNMLATKMLKNPLPEMVSKNLKCFMMKLNSHMDITMRQPNRLDKGSKNE